MPNIFSRAGCVLAVACALLMFCRFSRADDTPPPPQAVQNAIDKAQQFLLSKESDGNWESVPQRQKGPLFGGGSMSGAQFGGLTAVATYALLDSGVSAADPNIKQAIEFLKRADMIGIYALGLRCQVWHLVPQDASVRACMARDGTLLVKAMKSSGAGAGFYDYTTEDAKSPVFDHSVSQYGVLGLWACAQDGLELQRSYWQMMDSAWRKAQLPDGGWCYDRAPTVPNDTYSTVSMTAAGVATLFITGDQLGAGVVTCSGNRTDPQIERGLVWLGDHFDEFQDSGFPQYSMYGIERIGVASGRKYLGSTNWFARGARYFLDHQAPDGSFGDGERGVADTAFGLLFLVHGRAPVVLNKLDYRPDSEIKSALTAGGGQVRSAANWNQRPRDAANLVRWMGRQNEEVLNWQVVTLRQSAEDLHDAPILYVAGNEPLILSAQEERSLKQFVEEGGLVLFNADCRGAGFIMSVKKLARKLFPVPGEFTRIPPTHPLFTDEQYLRKKWKITPEVLGLNNGVRELMILIPDSDLAEGWQADNELVHPEQFELADNIFLYAVDEKNLRAKGETYIVRSNPSITATKKIRVARLAYAGPWDPEPGGWRRLAAVMHNAQSTDLTVENVKLGDGLLSGYKIAHLTGTAQFKLSEMERNEVENFVNNGGTLIVDSAGGRDDFSRSAEAELQAMFPDAGGLNTTLPISSPVYSQTGEKLTSFEYRRFAKKTLPFGLKGPLVRGMTINNRLAIFYSPEDLSGGLVGQEVDGINGYEPATATAIMSHILQYASK